MAVLVSNDFPPDHGGIQRCMSRLAKELALRNEDVLVVAPRTEGSKEFDARQRFRVLRYPQPIRLMGFLAMVVWLARARFVARGTYTLASMWFPGGLAACLIPRFLRGRLGVLAHGSEIAPGRGGLRRRLMRYVFSSADVVIANSHFTRELIRRAGVESEVVVVRMGIDAEPITPARSETPIILSVGRLVARKGFDTVIAALPGVLEKYPAARYEIVGDGVQRAELEAQVQQMGLSAHVTFLGAVNDAQMREAYARAWCFAMPVRTIGDDVEGFGLVYLEAALAELPAIGGFNSGADDVIVSGETGLLVDGTSSAAVGAAILSLLDDPDEARAMGIRGRERTLQYFTWSRTAAEIAGLLALDAKSSAEMRETKAAPQSAATRGR